jgi:WD40 repeat protein
MYDGPTSESKRKACANVGKLQATVGEELMAFVHEANRYMLVFRSSWKQFPVAVYSHAPQHVQFPLMKNFYIPEAKVGSDSDLHWIRKWFPSPRTVLQLPTGNVSDVTFSPDGKVLATTSGNMIVELWDTTAGKLLRKLEHSGTVSLVAFSAGGNLLACVVQCGASHMVQLWQPATGIKQQLLSVPHNGDYDITFSPDGKHLVLVVSGTRITVWDLLTQKKPRVLELNCGYCRAIKVSPDRMMLASTDGRSVRIWAIPIEREIGTLAADDDILRIAFSLDSRLLATFCDTPTVTVWDLATGTRLHTLAGQPSQFNSILFLSGSKLLAFGSSDGKAVLWDFLTGNEEEVFFGDSEDYNTITCSRDGRQMARKTHDSVQLLSLY